MADQSTDEALQIATAQFKKRMRFRTWSSIVLLVMGAWLLYRGYEERRPIFQASGMLFILYSGIIQARSFSAKRFVGDVRKELERKEDA